MVSNFAQLEVWLQMPCRVSYIAIARHFGRSYASCIFTGRKCLFETRPVFASRFLLTFTFSRFDRSWRKILARVLHGCGSNSIAICIHCSAATWIESQRVLLADQQIFFSIDLLVAQDLHHRVICRHLTHHAAQFPLSELPLLFFSAEIPEVVT